MTRTALPTTSAGRFCPLGPLGTGLSLHAVLHREGTLLSLGKQASGWAGVVNLANVTADHNNVYGAKSARAYSYSIAIRDCGSAVS
jgi:hypothetical protein